MTLFLPFYLCKSLASLCKFHEFGTTIRNWSSAFTKLQNSNPKPTNILENFINRAYYVYKFNPCHSEEPSITGKNHGRKKKKKEKKKLLSKLAASLARKSLRAQFSRPIETRFRPIHPPPSSPPLFPSRGKRLLIRARRTSALLAGRRRGGEERVLRVRAARGRTQGWTHSMHRRGERGREGRDRESEAQPSIRPRSCAETVNGRSANSTLHPPLFDFSLLAPRRVGCAD